MKLEKATTGDIILEEKGTDLFMAQQVAEQQPQTVDEKSVIHPTQ